jgi:hypothetical protein
VEKERLPTYNFISVTTLVTEPFPSIGFQITTEEAPPDDPPRNQLEQSTAKNRPEIGE